MAKNQSTYTLKIDAELGNLQQTLNEAKNSLSNFMASGNAPKGLEKAFEKISTLLGQITDKAGKPLDLKGLNAAGRDLDSVQESFHAIIRLLGEFDDLSDDIKLSFLSGDEQKKVKEASNALLQYGKAMEEVAKKQKLLDAAQKTNEKDKAALGKAKKKVSGLEDDRTLAQAKLSGAQNKLSAARNSENANPKDIAKYEAEVEKLTAELGILEKNLNEANIELDTAQTAYNESAQSVKKLGAEIKRASGNSLKQLKEEAAALGISLDGLNGHDAATQVEILTNRLEEFKREAMSGSRPAFEAIKRGCQDAEKSVKVLQGELKDGAEAVKGMDEAAAQREAFEGKIKQFLGLSGAAQVMRAALRDAMQTITELDAVMGQMAVVTDLAVGDYWDQLPEYADRASKLGVSITEAYEAATLYYQQGLKANEVTALSEQTLKMAAIAGLDAADATDRMTAALRGFNMELSEANAQNIADVYSELAAITAADVDEISTAMTKTASIASSAGMEFETTAAFLSQIIETTRESAETAGTAMKTVIARFQELKKNPSEIGEVDGEIVDANAIETALRTVGVSLRDSAGQFRELDEVFLELSSKWDSLDKNTQRYIATIAAGSRQQSRFIAMMSDYGRTTELVTAANNSAGASQKQFEKTTETLEYKINQLKNAWHEFTMGIMNSDLVKVGVDVLTKFLEIINKATSGLNGLGGSLTKIIGIVAIFNIGKALYEKLSGPISKFFLGDLLDMAYESGKQSAERYNKGAQDGFTGQIKESKKEDNFKVGYYRDDKGKVHDPSGQVVQESEAQRGKIASFVGKKTGADYWTQASQHKSKKTEAQKQLQELTKDTKEYKEKQNEILEEGKKQWDSYGQAIKQAGQMVTGAGMAMSLFGGILSSAGLEEAGEFFTKIGSGAMIAGTAISTIIPMITSIVGALVAGGIQTSIAWTWVSLVAIAIAAIAALIAVAINSIIKNSPEQKLKAAEKAADEAAEAADRAKESYEELSSGLEDLEDKYDALKELTKGTKEWNKAILEINSSVLDLISKYPELAQLVSTDNGVLTLDVNSDEVGAVLRNAYENVIHTSNFALGAKLNVIEKSQDASRQNLIDERYFNYSVVVYEDASGQPSRREMDFNDVGYETLSNEHIDELAKALAGGLAYASEEEQAKFAKTIELTSDALKDLLENIEQSEESITRYGQKLLDDQLQQESYYDSMATSIVSLVDTMGKAEQRINQMFNVVDGELYSKHFEEAKGWFDDDDIKLDKKPKKWLDDLERKSGGVITEEFITEAFAAAGYQYFDLLEDKRKLKANYTKDGQFYEKQKISEEEFKNVITTYYANQQTKTAAENYDQFITALSDQMSKTLTTEQIESFHKALENEWGDALTVKDLENLAGITKIMGAAYFMVPSKLRSSFDIDSLIDNVDKAITGADYLNDAGWENVTSGAARALDKVYGDNKNQKIQEDFNDIMQNLDAEQASLFLQTIASLSEAPQILENWDVALQKISHLGDDVVEFVKQSTSAIDARYSSSYLEQMGVSKSLISQYTFADETELERFHNTFEKWQKDYKIANDDNKKLEHELIEKTIEAIVDSREKQIDAYEEAATAELEANSNLISKISENVARLRELREEEDTKKAISANLSKQAYLSMDTSGQYALDILSLQSEEDSMVQNYEDQIIDNALNKLEEDNQKAMEQRERQIELMRQQLEMYKNSDQILAEAKRMINDAAQTLLGEGDITQTALGKLFNQGFISDYDESEFWNKLHVQLSQFIKPIDDSGTDPSDPSGTDEQPDALQQFIYDRGYKADEIGSWLPRLDRVLDPNSEAYKIWEALPEGGLLGKDLNGYKAFDDSQNPVPVSSVKMIKTDKYQFEGKRVKNTELSSYTYDGEEYVGYDGLWFKKDELPKSAIPGFSLLSGWVYKKYQTGGLADFTGPAWLDGTPSRPEYILNAAQTERFFSLVDVLEGINTKEDNKKPIGDNYFDINISVEKLENDYDVEQVADKIRRMIYEDASYRNVNAINLIR